MSSSKPTVSEERMPSGKWPELRERLVWLLRVGRLTDNKDVPCDDTEETDPLRRIEFGPDDFWENDLLRDIEVLDHTGRASFDAWFAICPSGRSIDEEATLF